MVLYNFRFLFEPEVPSKELFILDIHSSRKVKKNQIHKMDACNKNKIGMIMLPRCRRPRRFDDVFGEKVYLQGNLSGKQDKLPVLSEKREFLQAEIAAMFPLARVPV